jgi:nuclear pore complex protein Nup205
MSELRPLETLQALHGELVAVRQHRYEGLQTLEQLLDAQSESFSKLIDKPPRNSANRQALGTGRDHWDLDPLKGEVDADTGLGKVKVGDDEYAVNEDFVNDCLRVADDLDLDEIEAARILLDCDAEGDSETQSRPLWECAVIRFHQERRYLLDCMRLLVEVAGDDDLEPGLQDAFGAVAEEKVFGIPRPGSRPGGAVKKVIPRCMEAMHSVRTMLQGMMDKAAARNVLQQASLVRAPENQEAFDFSRSSLVEQHECLAAILHAAVEKRHATVNDFQEFLGALRKVDRYDHFIGKSQDIPCVQYVESQLLIFISASVSGSCCIPDSFWLDRGSKRPAAGAPTQPGYLQAKRPGLLDSSISRCRCSGLVDCRVQRMVPRRHKL